MTELKPFQKEGVLAIRAFRGRALLGDEQGLGKTIQALRWIKKLPNRRPVLIICQAIMKWTWEVEARNHQDIHACVIEGRWKNQTALPGDVVIINYEILESWLPLLLKNQPSIVILDEVQYCKNPEARRTQACWAVAEKATSVVGLSGTPMENRPAELWSIVRMINPSIFPSWDKFAWRYCKPVWTNWGWDFNGATNIKELHRILRETVLIRRLKKDVLLDLPDKVRQTVYCKLTTKQRAEYSKAKYDFINWLSEKSLAKATKAKKAQGLTKMGYLTRLAAKLKLDFTHKWIQTWFADNPGKKLVCFTNYTFVIDYLKSKFPEAVTVDGRVGGRKRQATIRAFQSSARVSLLLGNLKAAGTGVTLTAASVAVILDPPWTPGAILQGEDRIHRIGQTKEVTIYHLIAHKTIEEKLMKVIKQKGINLEGVLNGTVSDEDVFGSIASALLQSDESEW